MYSYISVHLWNKTINERAIQHNYKSVKFLQFFYKNSHEKRKNNFFS